MECRFVSDTLLYPLQNITNHFSSVIQNFLKNRFAGFLFLVSIPHSFAQVTASQFKRVPDVISSLSNEQALITQDSLGSVRSQSWSISHHIPLVSAPSDQSHREGRAKANQHKMARRNWLGLPLIALLKHLSSIPVFETTALKSPVTPEGGGRI